MVKCSFVLVLLSFSLFSKNKEQIAVLPFSSQGLEEKELFTIEESLRKELSESSKYNVMERSVLEKKLESEGINNLSSCDELACALVFGEFLSLNYVIQGRLSKIENTYTFSIRLIDIEKEIILDDFTEFFTGNFESLLKKIVPKLSKKIQRIRIRKWKVEDKVVKKIEEVQVEGVKLAAEEQKVSSVSTSTTLAPKFEFEKEVDKSELPVSPPEEIADKKKKEQKSIRDEPAEIPIAPATEELNASPVSPVSTSTTLAHKIEPEEGNEVMEKPMDKTDSVKSPPTLTFDVSEETKTVSEPKEIEKDLIKDPVVVQSETQSEIPLTRSIEERSKELVSEENREVEPSSLIKIDESSDKKSKKKRRMSRRKDRKIKSDQDEIALSTSPINSEFLQEDSKRKNFINNDSEIDNSPDDESASPSLVQYTEKESEKPAQSKENLYMPDDIDKTLIADIENEDPMNVNDLQEEVSNKKRKAVIITSGISAAVAVPVFIFLFSKKDEKEPNTFSLTVEWP